ncbi:MAG TPA: hypothetical protein VJP88_04500, partial [Caulobacteraceae bacterium]|nr:hypothetical protein [Caulobacteraceae bacterium]
MTILHSTLFPLGYPLIARYVFTTPGAFSVTAPAPPDFAFGATYIRAGVSAAGGFRDNAAGWGGGAAFAFAGEACTPGAVYTGQVGDSQHSRPEADDALGDGWLKRPDSSLLVYGDRGRWNGNPGLAANCTGTIKRDGSAATANAGGASAGDDADPYPLGFGG